MIHNPRQTEAYRVLLDFAVYELFASKGGVQWIMPDNEHQARIDLLRSLTLALYSKHHHQEFWRQARFRADCRLQDADVTG